MKPEAQRIAIAEACGWTPDLPGECDLWKHLKQGDSYTLDDLPDYLSDLNAMHEAEKVLGDVENWLRYEKLLCEGGTKFTFHATAAQRAEAFLRTIDKWTDS